MGILRLLFALSVLIYHAKQFFGYNIADSSIAILSFYILSGFYMALILDKKYTEKKRNFLFFSNRFLRIFPLYWITLLVTILLILIKVIFHIGTDDNAFVHYLHNANHTNPVLFFLEILNFIFRNITLLFTSDYLMVDDKTPGYLLVQQANTLQLELLFYLTAPFLMRLAKSVFLAIIVVYIVGFFGILAPSHLFPHTLIYVFFANLIFFLFGMSSYRFFYKKFAEKHIHPRLVFSIFLFYTIYLLLYNFIPVKYPLPFLQNIDIIYYLVFTCSLPFIFLYTNANILDSFFGKLSYPVYIIHFLVIKFLSNISIFKESSNSKTVLAIIITLGLSFLAVKYIEAPIDKFRQKRVKNRSAL